MLTKQNGPLNNQKPVSLESNIVLLHCRYFTGVQETLAG